MNKFVFNKELKKIVIKIDKEQYMALGDDKKQIKKYFNFSGKHGAWVSKSKRPSYHSHYNATSALEKLGFERGEDVGEFQTYEEIANQEMETAAVKKANYERYHENSNRKADDLQAEINSKWGDTAYFTQPIHVGKARSEAFGRSRERAKNNYEKGHVQREKSAYFAEKAEYYEEVEKGTKYLNRDYLSNKIQESKKIIGKLEKCIAKYDNENDVITWKERIIYHQSVITFMIKKLNEIGGVVNKEDLKVGYEVKTRTGKAVIERINPKSISIKYQSGYRPQIPIEKIISFSIPENWEDKKVKIERKKSPITENPFKIGDVLTSKSFGGLKIVDALEVIKVTKKTVTVRRIKIEDNIPQIGFYIGTKEVRKTVKLDHKEKPVIVEMQSCYRKHVL